MPAKSTTDNFGSVAILIHWVSALLIIGMLFVGFRIGMTSDPETRLTLVRMHAGAGLAVALLTLFRLAWWWLWDRRPAEVGGTPHWQARAAQSVHVALYAVILAMIVSGIAMIALSGAGPLLLGQAGALPDFTQYLPRGGHGILARLMLALLAAHVLAALYHQFVLKDRLLGRMGLGPRP